MVTYWVAITGNDANSGSSISPWRTLFTSMGRLTPGDTLNVLPGTYLENPLAYINISGTATNRITIKSWAWLGAKVRTGATSAYVVQIVADYVDFIGFDISTTDANGCWEGIHVYGSYNRILLNNIHDIPALTQTTGGGGVVLPNYTGVGNIVDRNKITFVGTPAQDTGALVHGIYDEDISAIITNNIIAKCSARAIVSSHGATNTVIANNLGLNNGNGIIVSTLTPPSPQQTNSNTYVVNNILYSEAGFFFALTENTIVSGCLYQNNLIYAPLAVTNGLLHIDMQNGVVSGTIQSDPQFVNYQPDGSGDYRLKGTSPAVGTGSSLVVPPYDYLGVNRPQGSLPTVGPYEYVPSQANARGGLSLIGA